MWRETLSAILGSDISVDYAIGRSAYALARNSAACTGEVLDQQRLSATFARLLSGGPQSLVCGGHCPRSTVDEADLSEWSLYF
jgi:hypothetical protein